MVVEEEVGGEEKKKGRGVETEFPCGSTQIFTLLSQGCASTTNLRAGIFFSGILIFLSLYVYMFSFNGAVRAPPMCVLAFFILKSSIL
jgi:hypothetical protein